MIKPQSTRRQHNDKICEGCGKGFIGYPGKAKRCKDCRKLKDKESRQRYIEKDKKNRIRMKK